MALDRNGWRDEGRPFTPTSLSNDEVLQSVIEAYPSHEGVTEQLHELCVGESVLISDAFGAIQYQGPGVFVAGGAGITPFIAIIRGLAARGDDAPQTLLFANKTTRDIICRNALEGFYGDRCHFILSEEQVEPYLHGQIDTNLLRDHIGNGDRYFCVCGPPGFVEAMQRSLATLGVSTNRMIIEEA